MEEPLTTGTLECAGGKARTNDLEQLSVDNGRLLALLTSRERDLVRGVIAGMRNREIAQELHIAEQSVKNGLCTVYQKCHVRNRLELALLAIGRLSGSPAPADNYEKDNG
jgi:DNA-binding NarL/FixJ family response regulator